GGTFTSYNGTPANYIIALLPDGSVDTSFDYGSGFNMYVSQILPVVDGSGDIYVAGQYTAYKGVGQNYLVRLTAAGAVNPVLNIGAGPNAYLSTVAYADDGSGDIYIGGGFTSYQATGRIHMARIRA